MKKILFIHHSTGTLLIRFGRVRSLLHEKRPDIELWDHAYNLYPSRMLSKILGPFTFRTGLSDQNGCMTGNDFDITISNNSPKEYAEIFSRSPKESTLKEILSFDIVIFKNCFPTSNIISDSQLSDYKVYYMMIFKSLAKYSNRFIVFTQPPLRREVTSPEIAIRAWKLASWIKQQEGIMGRNISVFNFFELLADSEGNNANMLRRKYCSIIPIDSHPNIQANREIGNVFVEYIIKKIR